MRGREGGREGEGSREGGRGSKGGREGGRKNGHCLPEWLARILPPL